MTKRKQKKDLQDNSNIVSHDTSSSTNDTKNTDDIDHSSPTNTSSGLVPSLAKTVSTGSGESRDESRESGTCFDFSNETFL